MDGMNLCIAVLGLFFFSFSAATTVAAGNAIRQYKFVLANTTVTRLCKTQQIVTVNGRFPGPKIRVNDGDTVVIKVINQSPYNASIHWHGLRQFRTGWADGPEGVTQCPIQPGNIYTYNFTVDGQEGTLWWHAHSSWLRATVYGAFIIDPKPGRSTPYQKPHTEHVLMLGEWWNSNPMDVITDALKTGGNPNASDALTVNSHPGDLLPCSSSGTVRISAKKGKRMLLRIINTAMNTDMFVGIADHMMTVVAVDALYTKQFRSNYITLGPGQTTDVFITANKSCGSYYFAAYAFVSANRSPFGNTTTTAILEYSCNNSSSTPKFPNLPARNDSSKAETFLKKLRSLNSRKHPVNVPKSVDENLLYTISLGLFHCPTNGSCAGPSGEKVATSMNNYSFVLPDTAILQAHYYNISGVYTTDFPDNPLVKFNYSDTNLAQSMWYTQKATKVKALKYNSTVQVALQGTGILGGESHPIHLHGYDFYVVGSGKGNYNAEKDPKKFNLVDPPMRNTVNVAANGWTAIRFVANNPGAWIMHCHLDVHISLGLGMVFIVEDGPTQNTAISPPPPDLPKC